MPLSRPHDMPLSRPHDHAAVAAMPLTARGSAELPMAPFGPVGSTPLDPV
jgi:hypothetical protein